MNDQPTSFGNQAPMKVQCAECHWQGSAADLVRVDRVPELGPVLCCPICRTPFARYPQRVEHLWSDPY